MFEPKFDRLMPYENERKSLRRATGQQPLSFIQRNEHVEMNSCSYSLSCTWMTIINCLFDASGSLSLDVSWEYIAKLLVAPENLI